MHSFVTKGAPSKVNINGDEFDPFYRYRVTQLKVSFANRYGGRTVFGNIDTFCSELHTTKRLFMKYLGKRLATKTGDGYCSGLVDLERLNDIIIDFINKYIICSDCGLPELDQETRKCNACGKK